MTKFFLAGVQCRKKPLRVPFVVLVIRATAPGLRNGRQSNKA